MSSADSELDRLESAAEKEVENGVDVRASSGNGVAKGEEEEAGGGALASGGALAGVLLVATLATMAGLGYMYKDQINTALIQFQGVLESRSLSSLDGIYLMQTLHFAAERARALSIKHMETGTVTLCW